MLVGSALLLAIAGLSFFHGLWASQAVAIILGHLRMAAYIAIGAGAIGWGQTHGGRAATLGGVLVLVGFVGLLVGFLMTVTRVELRNEWRVVESLSVGGVVIVAADLARRTLVRAPDALGWAGLAGAGLGFALRLLEIAGVGSRYLRPTSQLLLFGGLLVTVVSTRAALRRIEPAPDGPGASSQRALEEGVRGVRTYKNGVVVQLVTVVGGLVLGFLAMGARSQALAVVIALAILGGSLAGRLLVLLGVSRMRSLPLASGGAAHMKAAYAIYLVAFCLTVVVVVAALFGLVNHRFARQLQRVTLEADLIIPALVGQLLLLWGLARVGDWLRAPTVRHHAIRAMLWFFATAVLLFTLQGPGLLRRSPAALLLVLAVLLLVAAVVSLMHLFATLNGLESTLSRQAWVAPFEDEGGQEPPGLG